MPRLPLTRDELDGNRQAVCAAATKLFAKHGFGAVTMRAIAAETRRSHTAAYRYFRSKEEIFHLVRAAAFGRFADYLGRASWGEREPVRRMRKIFAAYLEFALADPDGYRLMFELTQGPKDETPEVAAAIARAFEHALVVARSALEAGLVEGDELSLAHFFWASAHGLVSLRLADQLIHGRTLEDLSGPMLDFILGRKAPAPVRRRARRKAS